MRAALLAAFLLLAAGCADPTDEADAPAQPGPSATPAPGSDSPSTAPAAPAAPAPPAAPSLSLGDCRNFGAVFPVPMDAARAALPAGFEPVPTPSDPAGGATLYVLGLRCASSAVGGNATGPVDLAYAELAVVPPADLAVAGFADATVPILFTTSHAAVGKALADLRLGLAGAGTADWVEHTGAGDVIVAAELDGASLTLRGAVAPGPAAPLGSGGFILYGVQEGQVRAVVTGSSEGGSAVDAAVTLESAGAPAPVGDARPAARGFSVSGFSLSFSLRTQDPLA